MGDEHKSGGHGASDRIYRPSFRWIWAIPAIAGVGVVGTLIYVSQVPSGVRWSVFGTALAIAAAAWLTGGIVGFLFGIPHTVQESTPSTGNAQHQANTNLEQVSDWLTKIIVGVGLVEIGRALPALSKLAESMKAPLGGLASSAAFGLGLTISYALLGFLFLYLWSRLGFLQELGLISNIQRQVDASESARSTALILVNHQLNSLKGGAAPTQDDLNKAIAAAPDSTRLEIFIAAERARSANWSVPNTKPLMELAIPVFRGLIAADKGQKHHRHHGSLGWALKDQVEPDWREASDELTEAITIRDKFKVAGWKLYEANRAICGIHRVNELPAGDSKIALLRTSIKQDLDAAKADQYAKQMVDSNDDIERWMYAPT